MQMKMVQSLPQLRQKLVLLGDINIDIFLKIPTFPPQGGDAIVEKLIIEAGGSAANTAVAAARLGLHAYMLGSVGEDYWGNLALQSLAHENVKLDHVRHNVELATGTTYLTVTPDGERTMFTYRGANTAYSPLAVIPEIIRDAAALHLSGYAFLSPPQSQAAWKAVELAWERSIPITLDIGVEPVNSLKDEMKRLIGQLDLVVLGEPECKSITGQNEIGAALTALQELGAGCIALKLGEAGCRLVTRDADITVPGFKVKVVDTTGAGDAFCAGLIYGMLRELSLPACGLLANAIGALATTRWGAGAALPTLAEIESLLQAHRPPTEQLRPAVEELLQTILTQ